MDGRPELERTLIQLGLSESVFQGERVLEVGAGNGPVYAIENARHRVGIDPLSTQSDALQDVGRQPNTSVFSGVGERLPFSDESFNIVMCINVLDHVKDPQKTLDEIFRVMVPGGTYLFRVHAFNMPQPIRKVLNHVDAPHPHHFHPDEMLSAIKSSGFKIEETKIDSEKPFSGHNFKKRVATGIFRFRKIGVIAKKP
jgi:ubiquinone/menaquinone biosynthesis C-methylase UbiE